MFDLKKLARAIKQWHEQTKESGRARGPQSTESGLSGILSTTQHGNAWQVPSKTAQMSGLDVV